MWSKDFMSFSVLSQLKCRMAYKEIVHHRSCALLSNAECLVGLFPCGSDTNKPFPVQAEGLALDLHPLLPPSDWIPWAGVHAERGVWLVTHIPGDVEEEELENYFRKVEAELKGDEPHITMYDYSAKDRALLMVTYAEREETDEEGMTLTAIT